MPPGVWLLLGYKAGDNAQVLALAEALGWPFDRKQMVYRRYELATNLILRDSLAGVVQRRSSPLFPPWPDLVISAGRRNEPVARWIKRRAGKPVRLVHFGRPWAPLHHFDLLITTPQYQLPVRRNVLRNTLPLHHVTADKLTAAAAAWSPRLAHLPRPYTAMLVGGHSGYHSFGKDKAARLARQANALARAQGGSLLLTTSARTPRSVMTVMQSVIDVPAYCFQWSAAGENPYYGYLALADAFIVTGDSVSMLAEACAARKPLYIFDITLTGHGGRGRFGMGLESWRDLRPRALVSRLATAVAPRRMLRDVGMIHKLLVTSGRAVWLGQPFPAGPVIPAPDDLERATVRVRELFDMSLAPRRT